MRHLRAAAAAGDACAQFNLGIMYDRRLDDNDHPAPGDRIEAVKWLSQAARQGLPRAQQRLAGLLSEDPQDPNERVEAYAWLIRAHANTVGAHQEQAQKGIVLVAAGLTDAQRTEAEEMARTFQSQEHYAGDVPARRRRR